MGAGIFDDTRFTWNDSNLTFNGAFDVDVDCGEAIKLQDDYGTLEIVGVPASTLNAVDCGTATKVI